jgi:hypothetical protein
MFEESEFGDVHKMILKILKDARKPLSNEEIAAEALNKYSGIPKVARWKDSSYGIGDIVRYVIIKPLYYLKQGGYVELSQDGKWSLIMEEPLMNEVIRGYASQLGVTHEQAVKQLLRYYIEHERTRWEEYVKSLKEYEKIEEESEKKRREMLEKLKQTFPLKD